jgi:hypothetical protein
MTYEYKYLHSSGEHTFILDHKLTPEVRAMFAAMTSRTPVGGLLARYEQVVSAVALSLYEEGDDRYSMGSNEDWTGSGEPFEKVRAWVAYEYDDGRGTQVTVEEHFQGLAEETLCNYPLHPRVIEFFNQFVREYGHSSILELTGSPTVYSDNLSWWTAWLLFDTPLVCGQENSTRAVTRKDWPMAREAYANWRTDDATGKALPHPQLETLHEMGMEIANAEIEAWKDEFRSPCPVCKGAGYHVAPDEERVSIEQLRGSEAKGLRGIPWCSTCDATGKKHPTMDKQAFRPALDHARWALPGTISTGVAYACHVRDRARAIQDSLAFYKDSPEALAAVQEIQTAYGEAVPGIGDLGLKEAWYEAPQELRLPSHLAISQEEWEMGNAYDRKLDIGSSVNVRIRLPIKQALCWNEHTEHLTREAPRTYADAKLNRVRLDVWIHCSMAVTRDWHRHRTMYPLQFRLIRDIGNGAFILDPHYEARSEHGKEMWEEYFSTCRMNYEFFSEKKDYGKAMLSIPFGARVALSCQMGLRDFLYTMELRAFTQGANFEYQAQAREALRQLIVELRKLEEADKADYVGSLGLDQLDLA